jgi:hypothetical protein
MYVKAVSTEQFTWNVNYAGITGSDEIQNNLDNGTRTNFDTWDPVPSGVWFGGWAIESQQRLSAVPDTNFSIALATVCNFGSDIIMSGAGRTLVRLPVYTPSSGHWTEARMNVYKIAQNTNWTFSKNIVGTNFASENLNNMKINFTNGPHDLIYWSETYSPTDYSVTDDNDHFTRSNRTYVFVDAPIIPGEYYLFVTYVWYPSDAYVEIFWQPDSLDSEGIWNRSTLAIYDEPAPDAYNLDVHNLNLSCGYSFDFRNGFGNSCYGVNIYCNPTDELEFWLYVNQSHIDPNWFPTFHLPFRSSLDNVSFDILIQVFDPATGVQVDYIDWDNYIANDFILVSGQDAWSSNTTAWDLIPQKYCNWFRVVIEINNATRLWIPTWNVPAPSGDNATLNTTWKSGADWFNEIWDSDAEFNYNLEMWFQHELLGSPATVYNYHWKPQATLQFNNYWWSKNVQPSGAVERTNPTENMTLTQKAFYAFGSFLVRAGDAVVPFSFGLGTALRSVGATVQFIGKYGDLPDPIGWVWDGIQRVASAFQTFGTWIWRAVQSAVGAISWFIETLTYYGSIILGILILILSFIVLFFPIWASAKIGQIIVKASLGDTRGAVDDMGAIAQTTKKMVGR